MEVIDSPVSEVIERIDAEHAGPKTEFWNTRLPGSEPDAYEVARLGKSLKLARAGFKGDVTYFVQAADGGPIKIGRSTGGTAGAAKRLDSLQTGSSVELVLRWVAQGDHEAVLHDVFGDFRLRGEWFLPIEALTDLCLGKGRGGHARTREITYIRRAYEIAYERGLAEGEDQARHAEVERELTEWLTHMPSFVSHVIGRHFGQQARAFARLIVEEGDKHELDRLGHMEF